MTDSTIPPAIDPQILDEAIFSLLDGRSVPAEAIGLDAGDLEKLTTLGVAGYAHGRYDKAARIFELLSYLQPDYWVAHHYLGLIAEKENRLDDAMTHLRRAGAIIEALPLRPQSMNEALDDITLVFATVLFRAGREDEAAVCLEELLLRHER